MSEELRGLRALLAGTARLGSRASVEITGDDCALLLDALGAQDARPTGAPEEHERKVEVTTDTAKEGQTDV